MYRKRNSSCFPRELLRTKKVRKKDVSLRCLRFKFYESGETSMSEAKIKELEDRLKSLEEWQQRCIQADIAAPTPQPKPQAPQEKQLEPLILEAFPEGLANMLTATIDGNRWILKPTQFLGDESFRRVLDTVQSLGGRYVSAGKQSHFEVPRK